MAHFAQIVDGIVVNVIVAEKEIIDTLPGQWVQTSYNTQAGKHSQGGQALRKNYAGVGFIYDKKRDAFYEPSPYKSWILNEETCHWESPTPYPADGKTYVWDETFKAWIITKP